MSGGRPGLEAIEAMVWKTGTKDAVLVARIMRAVRSYAQIVGDLADELAAARAATVLNADPGSGSATLAELLDPGGDGSRWWPR